MTVHDVMITALFLYAGATLSYFVSRERAGDILISLGVIVNAAGLILRGYVGGTWFLALMVDEVLSLPIFLALIVLAFSRTGAKTPVRIVTLALALCSLAAFLPIPAQALPSAKTQVLLGPVFFLTEAVSIALFIAGGFLALAAVFFRRDTDCAIRQCILWGFLIFTVCQVLGAVWAFTGWSYPFSWSPRHLASACIWCLYAALLHAGHAHISKRTQTVIAAVGLVPISFIVFHHELSHMLTSLAEIIP